MQTDRILLAGCLCALLTAGAAPGRPERSAPPRSTSPSSSALTAKEKDAIVSWTLARPEVRATIAGHRTRVLRVWSDVVKKDGGSSRRAIVLLRDYDTGTAHEISVDVSSGDVETRQLAGVQPSAEEIEEGMSIIRRDRALAGLSANPDLELIGGFHNRSSEPADPCAREICLEFAFMKPNYQGPARYVIVNLTRGAVAHHDFRIRPGKAPPRMTESPAP